MGFVAVCSSERRDHDASDQDVFVYRVAHSRARDAWSLGEGLIVPFVGRNDEFSCEWTVVGGCSLLCVADCSVGCVDASKREGG